MVYRTTAAAALAAALAAAALAVPSAAGAAESCRGEDDLIVAANIEASERALLCLVNVYRSANELSVLAQDRSLHAAARGHSEDMVRRGYIDHESPDGDGPRERAAAEGYPASAGIGENIGAHEAATPRRMLDAWRQSASHDENMLAPEWVTAGMGFAVGTPPPIESSEGATGTQLFGTADTGATYTGADLLEPEQCEPPTAKVERLERRVAKLKRKATRAKAAGKRAKKRKLRRRARGTRRKLREARAEAASACPAPSFSSQR